MLLQTINSLPAINIVSIKMSAGHHCPMCSDFSTPTIKLLLGHISRVHSHESDFNFTCGLEGCLTTYKSYTALKKHIQRKHKTVTVSHDVGMTYLPPDTFSSTSLEDNNIQESQEDEFKQNSAR